MVSFEKEAAQSKMEIKKEKLHIK